MTSEPCRERPPLPVLQGRLRRPLDGPGPGHRALLDLRRRRNVGHGGVGVSARTPRPWDLYIWGACLFLIAAGLGVGIVAAVIA